MKEVHNSIAKGANNILIKFENQNNMTSKQINILLADDDDDDYFFFKDALKEINASIQLHIVNNGDDLWDYLHDHETLLPDVIFLDMNMPGKTGIECLEKIRGSKKFQNLPVVIYSTSGVDKDIDASFRYGANVYIKKPTEFVKLKKMISNVIDMDWQKHPPRSGRDNFLMR